MTHVTLQFLVSGIFCFWNILLFAQERNGGGAWCASHGSSSMNTTNQRLRFLFLRSNNSASWVKDSIPHSMWRGFLWLWRNVNLQIPSSRFLHDGIFSGYSWNLMCFFDLTWQRPIFDLIITVLLRNYHFFCE